MYSLSNIANPAVAAETIQVIGQTEVPGAMLSDFRDFLGNPPESENSNLTRVLKSVLDGIAAPTTSGFPFQVTTWRMRIELCGKSYVYLPQHNGMNISSLDYDENGDLMTGAEWSRLSSGKNPIYPGVLISTEADPLPAVSVFDWTVGYNYEDIPADIKESVLGQAGYRVEFPLGVGDAGQPLLPTTPHFDFGMDRRCIVTDVRRFLDTDYYW